jgi:hypothetical protein
MVIPNRHHQSHATFQSGAHRSKTAVSLECVVVAEGGFWASQNAVVMELPVTFAMCDCELRMTLKEMHVSFVP